MMGAWIDLQTRKLTGLPAKFLTLFDQLKKADGFRVLTKADTRAASKKPQDLDTNG